MNRAEQIQTLNSTGQFDICIIGGGATGLGIAVDAASRGLKTILLEQHDFAKGTSSRSTKLVHGGVRYLQQGNIKLVMEALRERGLLLKNAPELVHNQPFLVPAYKWWQKPFYGIGLKIYDKMAGKLGLGPSLFLSKEETLERVPGLHPEDLKGGILYHDGQFDDARLAICLAKTAVRQHAIVLNYFPIISLEKKDGTITGVVARDSLDNKTYSISAKVIVNATGVFTDSILAMDDNAHEPMIRPSQGIHLVVDREFLSGETAIMIPATDDGRVLFAVPWHDKVVIGTTDTPVTTIMEEPRAQDDEIAFILRNISRYLTKPPELTDIRSVFAGLRPLVNTKGKSTAAIARDHLIRISDSGLMTIAGGKWTTYRKMGEDLVDMAIDHFKLTAGPCITKDLSLLEKDEKIFPAGIFALNEEELMDLVSYAVHNEACVTIEDFLSRRTRQLFLDASVAIEKAEVVAKMMATTMNKDDRWISEQINNFKSIAKNYLPKPN